MPTLSSPFSFFLFFFLKMSLARWGLCAALRSSARSSAQPLFSSTALLAAAATAARAPPSGWPSPHALARHFCSRSAAQPLPPLDDGAPPLTANKVSHFTTADLYDANMDLADKAELRVLPPVFQIYGQRRKFCGSVVTLMVSEDNLLIHEILDMPGKGKVLVIDAGAQMRRALVGGFISEKALKNGWEGMLINGCIRDVDDINAMDMGVRALASLPTKPRKLHFGLKHVPVNIGGVLIHEGEWLYADADGILVSKSQIFM